jgi:hypothetical protein
MNRYALRDDHWTESRTCCPANPVMSASPPTTIADSSNRCSTATAPGIPWRDLPERLGDWKNTHERFSPGANKGDLPHRQRSRRRWWLGNLGRVSETLRGKRS